MASLVSCSVRPFSRCFQSRLQSGKWQVCRRNSIHKLARGRNVLLCHHESFAQETWLKNHLARQACCFSTISSSDALVGTEGQENDEPNVEDLYSRKTQLEHIMLRPGMYIGPTERLPPDSCWVLDPTPSVPALDTFPHSSALDGTSLSHSLLEREVENKEPRFRMVQKEYALIPALVKVFDEILVNASDNRLRHPKTCSRIDVTIDPGSDGRDPFIRVFNDGKGVPIQIHRKENMYVPEMIFGHLLTGSNFDDNEKLVTGGRHGYGAKLTNIFSKSFTVETQDSKKKLRYRQTWYDNMTRSTDPEIIEISSNTNESKNDYTCVSFVPDISRLSGDPNSSTISPEDYAVMCRRVVDVAGCSAGKLKVSLNGYDVSMESFIAYSSLYRKQDSPPLCFQAINSRWKVAVGLSESASFEMISFVNGMSTNRGGNHVNAIVSQLTKPIQEKIHKLDPELVSIATQGFIRRHLFVSCDTLIENPTFDSQMKEYLTSNPNNFGSSCTLSDKFIKDLLKSEENGGPGIVEEVIRVAKGRQQANLLKHVGKKTRRQLLSIPKLDDAHEAGTNSSSDCTLILTEGDSAKALAVAGLEVIGRDKFGVFPLRGKFLNVRDASVSQLTGNAEVKALVAILGLDFDKEYNIAVERAELRYGHIMLMTDQDTDGSHIKGLLINFFRHFWPNLLKPPADEPEKQSHGHEPFLSSFITPLLKASKRKAKTDKISFYSMAEYNAWKSSMSMSGEAKNWKIKYYKGLGTSTPAEAKEYFSEFNSHHRPFHWSSDLDGELLDMVFDKKRAADRREWILDNYDSESSASVDQNNGNSITYGDFVNKEMIHFSHADNIRSLPSLIDGLKPSQRKVMYACFKRKLKSEIKVAQLTGYCAEHTAYHHGEASLQSTVIGLAQDFVGSNNINLLTPVGQFGTRLAGGEDAASPRYIFTHLSPIARYLFPELDDDLLDHREDDGQIVEPEYFCPILPLAIINGSKGIGTGWSTFIPPHNPRDVLDYIRAKLDGIDPLPSIRPFARGFKGSIEPLKDGNGFITRGKAEKISPKSILITELPLYRWTNTYKDHLLKMRDRGDIADFVENHTTSTVSFTVNMKSAQLSRMMKSGLTKAFKLESNLLTTNMNAFDANNTIQKFSSAESIADAYFPIRMQLYHDRKSVLESETVYSAEVIRNKARFIKLVTDGELDLVKGRQSRDDIVKELSDLGFHGTSELIKKRNDNIVWERRRKQQELEKELLGITENENLDGISSSSGYDYLLNMPLSSLTSEKIKDLNQEADKIERDLTTIKSATPADLWRDDLEKLSSRL